MPAQVHAERPRSAAGPERRHYLDHGDVDRVMTIVLALATEVGALRERLDTHERLAAAGVVATPGAVEAFAADAAVEGEREAWRDSYLRRLFRTITEDVEAVRAGRTDAAEPVHEGNNDESV